MSKQLDRISRQLEAIDLAIAAARAEGNPARRDELWGIVTRATAATRAEYAEAVEVEAQRPALHLLNGGLDAAPGAAGDRRAITSCLCLRAGLLPLANRGTCILASG